MHLRVFYIPVLFCMAYRYATHRDIRALGLDMFRQFMMLQVLHVWQYLVTA